MILVEMQRVFMRRARHIDKMFAKDWLPKEQSGDSANRAVSGSFKV
jgi:hypothetical protein